MTVKEIRRDVTDIKIMLGKIEQHLKDMNGKLIAHDNFISEKCPVNRKEMYSKIDKLFWSNIGGWTILSGIVIAVVFGWI